ncbi:MAG: hypothetical protein GW903_04925 [Alphaproteobacteria bacterium]|nr:hypothetical protein [Alphaproteobacteria bacterium]NCQ88313.1 hypothetical protein [Alphaproteobacteria bacterium]NCT05180.1 hypothetical protein [Alphaproteobacteria bacterium]
MTGFNDIRRTVDPSGAAEGTYIDTETMSAAADAAQALATGNIGEATNGALAAIEELGTEQDGFVVGYQGGEARAGFQEQTTTEVLDADGNVVSSQTLTFGAYAEADGDLALSASAEGFRNFEDSQLSYGASLDAGTDALTASGAVSFSRDTDWGSYGAAAGASFQKPLDGSETSWSAAVLGEVTYDNSEILQQWGTYAFAEAGVYADPSGVDPVARVGLGKETSFGDVRVGVDQSGGVGISTSFKF